MKIIFKQDSRDKKFHQHFGQVLEFPDELNFDTAQYDDPQPIGNVQCTCFTTCDIAEDQENREFNVDDLWNRINHDQFGADPREVLGEAVKNGLLPKGQSDRVKDWKSYWKADEGIKDKFDNVRSALMVAQSPIGCGTYWYSNWTSWPILQMPETPLNGHMYSIEGWKQINGKPHLIIEAWVGQKLYMPREVFNKVMSEYGVGAWVLSTSEIDAKRDKTILETIKDACINVIILLKALLVLKQKLIDNPIVNPVKDDYQVVKEALKLKGQMITKWANAIAKWEGDVTGVNPGNLKFAPLTQSWGAKKGRKAQDGGYFCLFDSYDLGFNALCKFLELGCKDELKSFHNARTIEKFMIVYAGNPPRNYLNGVIKDTGVDKDTDISTFLL